MGGYYCRDPMASPRQSTARAMRRSLCHDHHQSRQTGTRTMGRFHTSHCQRQNGEEIRGPDSRKRGIQNVASFLPFGSPRGTSLLAIKIGGTSGAKEGFRCSIGVICPKSVRLWVPYPDCTIYIDRGWEPLGLGAWQKCRRLPSIIPHILRRKIGPVLSEVPGQSRWVAPSICHMPSNPDTPVAWFRACAL